MNNLLVTPHTTSGGYTEQIGQLIHLPQGEDPTIAEVFEREKLDNQWVFANAQNGDVVLVYAQAKKIILYRPSTNKLVDVISLPTFDATASAVSTKSTSSSSSWKP